MTTPKILLTKAEIGMLLLALDEYRDHHPDMPDNHVRAVVDSAEAALLATSRATTTEKCGTADCNNAARWFSIPEGNQLGNNAIRRCAECCDRLADTDWLPANYLAARY